MPIEIPARAWPQTVIVEGWGTSASRLQERMVLKKWEGEKEQRVRIEEKYPLHDIQEVLFVGPGTSVSTDLLHALVQNQIAVCFADFSGDPYAFLSAPGTHATVATRRAQLLANESAVGMHLARALVEGKLRNQAATLKYLGKNRRESSASTALEEAVKGIQAALRRLPEPSPDIAMASFRQSVMVCEALAAKSYWQAIGKVLEPHITFSGREHRAAADPVNICLNYGYGILYARIWQATIMAGLEPFAGFLHTDRPGKPSFVLDLAEEFRPLAVDRAVVSFFTRGSTVQLDADNRLDSTSRRRLAGHLIGHMDARHPYRGKKHTLTGIMHQQARAAASYLRGEQTTYRPFRARW